MQAVTRQVSLKLMEAELGQVSNKLVIGEMKIIFIVAYAV
jgi:hypothetical protein